ncbi:NAD-dependent epimerase/dehydratase [Hysterangium stoloniferum]|nr:NAD-dependent epimerase/dehydratase [Hysterangium stoloniferum]
MITKGSKVYLVTGGAGFIGSHIAECLHTLGENVRVVDIHPKPSIKTNTNEYICGDLRNSHFCDRIVKNVHTVIHMAANMGGMGTIHGDNDFIVFQDNSTMTTNILKASVKAGVKCVLFASSACVYPACLQSNQAKIIGLKESHAWSTFPPSPQGLYGLEKLMGEMLILQYRDTVDIKIARFHNVYGPGGTWTGGREKAPAAFSRKAVVRKMAQCPNGMQDNFEIWGDGTQRRSFLYISDAVDAILRLLRADGSATINVGSEEHVSMKELADIACAAAELHQKDVRFSYNESRPIGVECRTSDNTLAKRVLNGWEPTVSLKEGMALTVEWVKSQIEEEIAHNNLDGACRSKFLDGLRLSSVLNLEPETVIFAILLPVTSRGTSSPEECLDYLTRFGLSLWRTTKHETHPHYSASFRIKIYLALDSDDGFLVDGTKAEDALQSFYNFEIHRIVCDFPKGHVCSLWRECAKRAWKEGADYMCLMGDDVELLDAGWLTDVSRNFSKLSNNGGSLAGFGCVAFTDVSFPGMPTFPIVSKVHMDIFGEVIPDCFINQDGDPYLFQLYRRFGSSLMIPSRIQNNVGGSENARYRKKHAADWTFGTLDRGTEDIINWMKNKGGSSTKKMTLDVVVPSYRVQMRFLKPILELKTSPTCSVMWIIIIDDPQSPSIGGLQREYGKRADVRIRVNAENSGASASRNRGMEESAAEWILFLDDDVTPREDLLIEAEAVIRMHPHAAGFVGNAQFPPANTIFKTAVHLAGVTYFWDIADKIKDDLPWGVTANLIVRRVKDNISFNLKFPKTGGGEDIDYCVRKRDWFVNHGMQGFQPAPKVVVTHPWWNEGRRTYHRFFMWGRGDGALVSMFPQHCYVDMFPNSAELALYCFLAGTVGLTVFSSTITFLGYGGVLAVLLASIGHDFWQHRSRKIIKDPRTTLTGFCWVMAIMEGSVIRISSEGGRLVGQLERGEFIPFRPRPRFDWFVGRIGDGPAVNDKNQNFQRFLGWTFIMCLVSLTISRAISTMLPSNYK